jgi:enoyl-CoA hydratase/carnithine racemase
MDEALRELRGGALWLTINREAKRNALSAGVVSGLAAGLEAARDPAVRAVVITGAGDRAFCAGADLDPGSAPFVLDPAQPQLAYADLLRAMMAFEKPIIARINGACVAGGMGLLAAADIAIAADHASFALPEVKIGVFPMMVDALLLQRLRIAPRIVAMMSYSAEGVNAETAMAAGLVNRVVPTAGLNDAVDALVAMLNANSPTALRLGKTALNAIMDMPVDAALRFAEAQIKLTGQTQDAREGLKAFAEKRPPQWTGQ